jgi:hypothetical protein
MEICLLRKALPIITLLMLTCGLPPSAQAQEVGRESDVMLAVDLSLSMKTSDPRGNRFIGADKFLSMSSFRPQNRAGIVSFGNDAVVEMTLSYLSADRAGSYVGILEHLDRPAHFTELGRALTKSRGQLGQPDGRMKSIIVISDGIVEGDPRSRGVATKREADMQAEKELWSSIIPALKANGVVVYTIGLIEEDARGERTLQRIANETGGFYRRVTSPGDFTTIYEELLFSIGRGSAIDTLNNGRSTIRLSPFDEGLIICGPRGMAVDSPRGTAYPQKDAQPNSPVKQYFVTYKDGSAILFLGRPTSAESVSKDWSGPWTVTLNGTGKMIRFSKARLIRDQAPAERRMYFKNELMPIRVKVAVEDDGVSGIQDFLNKCTAKYTIVSQEGEAGWTRSGALTGKGNIFQSQELADHPGNHLLQVQLYVQDPEQGEISTLTYLESFHVSNSELFTINTIPELRDGAMSVGDKFKVYGKLNKEALKESPDIRGFSLTGLDLKLKYNGDKPEDAGPIKPAEDSFESPPLKLEEAGDLTLLGDLTGDLIVNGDQSGLIHSPVSLSMFNTVKAIRRPIWPPSRQETFEAISLLAAVLGIFGFFRHRQWKKYDRTRITNQYDNPTDFSEASHPSIFGRVKRPIFLIGGKHSTGAHRRVDIDTDEIIAEIGISRTVGYYVKRLGETDVYVDNTKKGLEKNQKVPVDRDTRIIIGDEEFRVSDLDSDDD